MAAAPAVLVDYGTALLYVAGCSVRPLSGSRCVVVAVVSMNEVKRVVLGLFIAFEMR